MDRWSECIGGPETPGIRWQHNKGLEETREAVVCSSTCSLTSLPAGAVVQRVAHVREKSTLQVPCPFTQLNSLFLFSFLSLM